MGRRVERPLPPLMLDDDTEDTTYLPPPFPYDLAAVGFPGLTTPEQDTERLAKLTRRGDRRTPEQETDYQALREAKRAKARLAEQRAHYLRLSPDDRRRERGRLAHEREARDRANGTYGLSDAELAEWLDKTTTKRKKKHHD